MADGVGKEHGAAGEHLEYDSPFLCFFFVAAPGVEEKASFNICPIK